MITDIHTIMRGRLKQKPEPPKTPDPVITEAEAKLMALYQEREQKAKEAYENLLYKNPPPPSDAEKRKNRSGGWWR